MSGIFPFEWLYWSISWLLLSWHSLWDAVLPDGRFLGTDWSWILSIIFLTLTVRVIVFPLFVKQIRSQRAMQALQPKVKELQAKYKHDRQEMQKQLMELYRKEKANPLMGCLPMLLQSPVFLGLLHILRRVHPGNTNTTLYGWTDEQFNSFLDSRLFNAPIWANFRTSATDLELVHSSQTTVKILCAVLIACMVFTTYMTSRQMILKTGWAEDRQQKMMQRLMLYGIPATLLISGVMFPIGVVLYWVISNAFSLGQQMWVLRKYPPPKIAGVSATKATGKPGSKAAEKARAEAVARAKELAPKPGAKPAAAKAAKAAAPAKPGAAKTASPAAKTAKSTAAKPGNSKKGGARKGAGK